MLRSSMRRPDQLEVLYLDFDGFFASVAQQVDPKLRGKPVGIVPFDAAPTKSMTVIAVSKEAKKRGREERDARPGCSRDLSGDRPRAAAPGPDPSRAPHAAQRDRGGDPDRRCEEH